MALSLLGGLGRLGWTLALLRRSLLEQIVGLLLLLRQWLLCLLWLLLLLLLLLSQYDAEGIERGGRGGIRSSTGSARCPRRRRWLLRLVLSLSLSLSLGLNLSEESLKVQHVVIPCTGIGAGTGGWSWGVLLLLLLLWHHHHHGAQGAEVRWKLRLCRGGICHHGVGAVVVLRRRLLNPQQIHIWKIDAPSASSLHR